MAHNILDYSQMFYDRGVHLPSRTLYLGSEGHDPEDGSESGTDFQMAKTAIAGLHLLSQGKTGSAPIKILMNNIGGNVSDGLAIYDAIRGFPGKVSIHVLGQACSMGSVILQAADDRIMSQNSVVMIHFGQRGLTSDRRSTDSFMAESRRIDKWMEDMLLAKIRKVRPAYKAAQLRKKLETDTYLSAVEAVEMGLADRILDIPEVRRQR